MSDFRPRLKGQKLKSFQKWNKKENRVLIIGDTHCPFDLDTYLDFLVDTYNAYNCNRVVHIGDEIDNHYSSYHETDADGVLHLAKVAWRALASLEIYLENE